MWFATTRNDLQKLLAERFGIGTLWVIVLTRALAALLVGFDAMPEAAYFCPPLTTVRQNLHELGSIAAKQVIHMIEVSREPDNSYESGSVWLKPELIVRESSMAS